MNILNSFKMFTDCGRNLDKLLLKGVKTRYMHSMHFFLSIKKLKAFSWKYFERFPRATVEELTGESKNAIYFKSPMVFVKTRQTFSEREKLKMKLANTFFFGRMVL